ncbi:MAG: EAL domain-containing protein [Amphritea sp.]|nr:EAL domain-containing protein [Amphritea sp.]
MMMQFNTIKNLGLSILTGLLLCTVVVGVYFNNKTMAMLDTVIEDKAPVQEQIFSINRLLESATKEFYAFIRARKVYREDVLLPVNKLHQQFADKPWLYSVQGAEGEYYQQHTARLLDIFQQLIDPSQSTDQVSAVGLEQDFIEQLLRIGKQIEDNRLLSAVERETVSQQLVIIEVAFVRFLEKQEADLGLVFSILDDVDSRLRALLLIPGTNEKQVETLLSELTYTRSALQEYDEHSGIGISNLLSLTEAEINVLDAWTGMRDSISMFNEEMRQGINDYQNEMAQSSQKSNEYLLFSGLASLLLAVVVSILIGRTLASRINKLVTGIRNIAEGDYDYRLNFRGQDELAFLANSFDAMSMQLKNKELALYQQAHFDSLTGLPNRRKFLDSIEHALAHARRNNEMLVAMFIDLDNFKRINDSLGHAVGDALLSDVARRLTENIRCSDILSLFRNDQSEMDLYRLGGDEFVILLRDLKQVRDAALIAERILDILTTPTVLIGYEMHVSASIGISVYPDDAADMEGLVKHADVAMYHAKDIGKNGYQFYSDSMNKIAIRQIELENKLRRAIDADAFELHYQPQVDPVTHRVHSLEALLRWYDADYGMVPPTEFIAVAENSNLIIPIGNWVITRVCEQIRHWQVEDQLDVKVSINLSSVQFNAPDFARHLLDTVLSKGVQPQSLVLELTESVIMDDSDRNISMLHELRQMGFELSVDDFGTGYSSLSYLKLFPLNELKIDRSFVDDIPGDSNNMAICSAIIAMANKLGLRVVAEGVETAAQQQFLEELGCNVLQGYHFSKPVPPELLDYSCFSRLPDAARQIRLLK